MFRSLNVPVNVLAVAVPPNVTPVPAAPVITSSTMFNVTVILLLATSMSANGELPKSRLPVTSSVNAKVLGAIIVGASFTAVMLVPNATLALETCVPPPRLALETSSVEPVVAVAPDSTK